MQFENISHEDPLREQRKQRVDFIINKIKSNFRLTKINAQMDEIKDWVFEMIPELVLVTPSANDVSHFDHFSDENSLFQSILRYIRRLYNDIEAGGVKAYGGLPSLVNTEL